MRINVSFTVTQEYFAAQIAYDQFAPGNAKFVPPTKTAAREVLRKHAFWYGKGGWSGDLTVAEALGDGGDQFERYEQFFADALEWVKANYPNI